MKRKAFSASIPSPLSGQPCSYFMEKAEHAEYNFQHSPHKSNCLPAPLWHPWPAFLSGDPPLSFRMLGPRNTMPPASTWSVYPYWTIPLSTATSFNSTGHKSPPIPAIPLIFIPFYYKTPLKSYLHFFPHLSHGPLGQTLIPTIAITHSCQPLISSPNPTADHFLCNRLPHTSPLTPFS